MNPNFGKIEQELKCSFPSEFKEYISSFKKEDIILELFDEDYRILYSITKTEIKDFYEYVANRSSDFEYYPEDYPGDKNFIKIPFARNLSGDKFKYLYFLCKEGEESNGEIYIQDIDSPHVGRVKLSNNLELIKGTVSEVGDTIRIDCIDKSFDELKTIFNLTDNIVAWKDSFGIGGRENPESKYEAIALQEIGATIYESEKRSESFVKFELHYRSSINEKLIFSSKAYAINIWGLKYEVENNINYRIFYHKFICVLDGLKETVEWLIENGEMTKEQFNQIFSAIKLINQTKKGFNQIDYGVCG